MLLYKHTEKLITSLVSKWTWFYFSLISSSKILFLEIFIFHTLTPLSKLLLPLAIKKKRKEKVRKLVTITLVINLDFTIDSWKCSDLGLLWRFYCKTVNRDSHRLRQSLQGKNCKIHSPCPKVTHAMQFLPWSTEILGLQAEHWLSLAGSELPAPSRIGIEWEGPKGEEEEINLAFDLQDVENWLTSETILRKRQPLWTRKALLSDVLLLSIACSPCSSQTSNGFTGGWLEWGMHNAGLCVPCQAPQLWTTNHNRINGFLPSFSHCSLQSELQQRNMRQLTFQKLFHLASWVSCYLNDGVEDKLILIVWVFFCGLGTHLRLGQCGFFCSEEPFPLCQRRGFILTPGGSLLLPTYTLIIWLQKTDFHFSF